MASIYKPLAAFERNLEVLAHSVKKLSHHIHMSRPLKDDLELAIWGIKRAAECGIIILISFLNPWIFQTLYFSQMHQ